MTVYVDDFRVPARVGLTSGRWSHLSADTVEELHAFADRLGLSRSWFQDKGDGRWHYDVVDSKRAEAIRLGAMPIGLREFGRFILARRTGGVWAVELPKGPDGIGYAMWIFRYRRGEAFEEIHVPRHDGPGEWRAMRDRARSLADETGSAVAWCDGVTSANTNTNHLHPDAMTSMWLVAWPRNAQPGTDRSFTNWKVVECPHLDRHQGRP